MSIIFHKVGMRLNDRVLMSHINFNDAITGIRRSRLITRPNWPTTSSYLRFIVSVPHLWVMLISVLGGYCSNYVLS